MHKGMTILSIGGDMHVQAGDTVEYSDGSRAEIKRELALKLLSYIGDWMLLIEPHKICMVPPGERDPDTGWDKMPPMKWVNPDDDAHLRAILAMVGNQQEVESFLPDFYVRGIDEM